MHGRQLISHLPSWSVREARFYVRGRDFSLKAPLYPITFTEQSQVSPSTRNRSQLRVPGQRADDRRGLGTAPEPRTAQYIDGVLADI